MSLRRGQVGRHRYIYRASFGGGGGGGGVGIGSGSSLDAFSYDVLVDQSLAAPNAARQVTVLPRGGPWPSNGNIVLSANNATFSGAGTTLTVTAGSSAPITTTMTPTSAAEIVISSTNTAGLIDPSVPRRMNAAVTGSGVAGTITSVTQVVNLDYRPYARESYRGNPSGWSTGWDKGWAPFPISITLPVGSSGLYARLYDASSTGATTSVGTGTMLQDWVQVYGTVASGTHTYTLLLPASPYIHFLELSLNSAGSNPVRLTKRFLVGDVIFTLTRSNQCGLGQSYPQDNTSMPPDLSVIVPYTKTASMTSGDLRFSVENQDFVLQDGNPATNIAFKTPGAMEVGRIHSNRTGVTVAITGVTGLGGNINDFAAFYPGYPNNAVVRQNDQFGTSCFPTYVFCEMTSIQAATGFTTLSPAQYKRFFTRWFANLRLHWPGPWGLVATSATDFYLWDGSTPIHWGRQTTFLRQVLENSTAIATVGDMVDSTGMFSNSGHANHMTKVMQARCWMRLANTCQSPERGGFPTRGVRGPVAGSTGTWVSDYVIEIPFTHNGGTTLSAVKTVQNNFGSYTAMTTFTHSTPTARELTQVITFRLSGNCYTRGRVDNRSPTGSSYQYAPGVAVKLAGVTIDNARNVLVCTMDSSSAGNIKFIDNTTLPLTTAKARGFTAFACSDSAYEQDNTLYANGLALVDDQTHDGIPYGFPMRFKMDIYVAPTTPGSQALGPFLAQPTAGPGDYMRVQGSTGTGVWASDPFVLKLDGTTLTVFEQYTLQDNSWSGYVQVPAGTSAGSHTLGVYRAGQGSPDATTTFTVATRSSLLATPGIADSRFMGLSSGGASSCVAWWSARHGDKLYQDVAGTSLVTANMQDVKCWTDAIGGNQWVQGGTTTLPPGNTVSIAPAFDLDCSPGEDTTSNPVNRDVRSPAIAFETTSQKSTLATGAPLLGQVTGDFTLLLSFAAPQGSASIATPIVQLGGSGGTNGIALWDGNGIFHVARGANDFATYATMGSFSNVGLSKVVVRYRASDDLLEVWKGANSGRGVTAKTGSKTGTPGAVTLVNGLMFGGWCWQWDQVWFNTRLSDADIAALQIWQSAVTVP